MFLTILTPSYNRVQTLPRLYDSLQLQTNKEFQWLVVDDGSTDATREFINRLGNHGSIKIDYLYKPNGGKHTAINAGMKKIRTPLTFIVDSDDALTEDAVETIYDAWVRYKDRAEIGSWWFLQSDYSGQLTGDRFPQNELVSSFTEMLVNAGIRGDKRAVYLTEARRKHPFPVFAGEKFIGESTVHKQIGDEYNGVFINKVIYKGEYIQDGLSRAGRGMRIRNPLGGMANCKVFMAPDVALRVRMKKSHLYVVYGLFAGRSLRTIIAGSDNPVSVSLCIPLSYLLYRIWRRRYQ